MPEQMTDKQREDLRDRSSRLDGLSDNSVRKLFREIDRQRDELTQAKADWKEICSQNDECHRPAGQYELLLARIDGEPTNHGDCRVAAELDRLQGERDTYATELTDAEAKCKRLAGELVQAQANCGAFWRAASFFRSMALSGESESDASRLMGLVFRVANPGQALLDELARLRRLEAALEDDTLADRVRVFCDGRPTVHETIEEAITTYRQALRDVAEHFSTEATALEAARAQEAKL